MARKREPAQPPAGQPGGYGSFVVRWRRLVQDAERIEVEHIQTGQRTLVESPDGALDWMRDRLDTPDGGPAQGSARGPASGAAPGNAPVLARHSHD